MAKQAAAAASAFDGTSLSLSICSLRLSFQFIFLFLVHVCSETAGVPLGRCDLVKSLPSSNLIPMALQTFELSLSS